MGLAENLCLVLCACGLVITYTGCVDVNSTSVTDVYYQYNDTASDNFTLPWGNTTDVLNVTYEITMYTDPTTEKAPRNKTKGSRTSVEDNSGFFKKEMIIGLAAGFVFFIILTILCCVGFSAMGKVCGDGGQAKNKVGPMDLRCCNEDAGDVEMQRKLSTSTTDDLESAVDRFKTEDHTTVTCSTGQFSGMTDETIPRSKRSSRSYTQHLHEEDEESDESDQFEESQNDNSNVRNPFRSRQSGLLPPIPRGQSARSSEGSSSNNTGSMSYPKSVSRLPPICTNQQGTGSRSYNLRSSNPTQGHNDNPSNYNYVNSRDGKPRQQFKTVDLRF